MKRIIILGTGGNCVDILDTLNDVNAAGGQTVYQCVGFLDDNPQMIGTEIAGVKVLGSLDSAARHADCSFINGIGSPLNFWKKEAIIARTGLALERFETLIHPTASVSRMAELGRGVVVFQHVTVTARVRIGHHVIILPNSVISHDDVIGDYTCVAGGVSVSGGVRIGPASYLGAGSSIKGNLTIGGRCLVGMGSVVINDVPDNTVVVGNPARPLRKTVATASPA